MFGFTLAGIAIAVPSPCFSFKAAATSWQGPGLRELMVTFAPAAANCSAIALPIPREDPVIIADFPERSNKLIGASFKCLDFVVVIGPRTSLEKGFARSGL